MDVGKLEAQERRKEEARSSAEQIREVLFDWRVLCKPKAKIVANSPRWRKVSDRLKDRDEATGEPAYSVSDLKYATRGALLSRFHRDNGYLDAVTIFRDPDVVGKHLKRYWTWAFTPAGEYHFFWRVQDWLRGNAGESLADALMGDRLYEERGQHWDWWRRAA